MNWLSANAFFVVVLLLCVGVHFFHGHGGHSAHGDQDNDSDHHRH